MAMFKPGKKYGLIISTKKKEQEMKIAANIAAIREDEVTKGRRKIGKFGWGGGQSLIKLN